jgi:hypothetical protein
MICNIFLDILDDVLDFVDQVPHGGVRGLHAIGHALEEVSYLKTIRTLKCLVVIPVQYPIYEE